MQQVLIGLQLIKLKGGLVRISPFNANDKRQTSFAGVEVMPKIEEEVKLDIPEKDLELSLIHISEPTRPY